MGRVRCTVFLCSPQGQYALKYLQPFSTRQPWDSDERSSVSISLIVCRGPRAHVRHPVGPPVITGLWGSLPRGG